MKEIRPHYYHIDLLKFIAIILITNSHFKSIYEGGLSNIGFGGAMGCAIFFFCSGFTLFGCESRPFVEWFVRRIIRIYPAYYLILVAYWIMKDQLPHLEQFLFPNCAYWFLQAIIIFYVLYYLVMKFIKKHFHKVIFLLFLTVFFIYSLTKHVKWDIDYALNDSYIHWVYYFAIMLIGGWMREIVSFPIPLMSKIDANILVPFSSFIFIIAYSLKYIVERNLSLLHIQLLFPFLLVLIVISLSEGLKRVYANKSLIIEFFSSTTLEIYLVQFLCIEIAEEYSFPLRLLICVTLIFITAYCLKITSNWLSNYLEKMLGI